jgi:hypothetical protein
MGHLQSLELEVVVMNFNGDFLKLGQLDVSPLLNQVLSFTEDEWLRDSWRQTQYKVHQDTATIPLLFDADFRHAGPTVHPMYATVRENIEPVISVVRSHYDAAPDLQQLKEKRGPAYPARMMLVRLKPGGVIPPHRDRNFSLAHSHRVHVPLVTHDDVRFTIGGRFQPLKVSEVWEVNNRRVHEVMNASPVHRIHLIVDWAIPGERCCCAASTHPDDLCTPANCQMTDSRTEPCTCLN